MAENTSGMSATAPKLQKRLAAAKKNRRRRHIGQALILITALLLFAGRTVGGSLGDFLWVGACVLLPVGTHLASSMQEAAHG